MGYTIRTERVKGTSIAVVRRRARQSELSRVVPEACGVVWKAIKAAGVKGGRLVAVYRHADGGQFDVEIGAEVDTEFPGSGEVVASMLPGGEVAATTLFGPYDRLGEVHKAVQDWCAANGRTAVEPCWELYGHWVEEWNRDPSKIRTDVYYLIR